MGHQQRGWQGLGTPLIESCHRTAHCTKHANTRRMSSNAPPPRMNTFLKFCPSRLCRLRNKMTAASSLNVKIVRPSRYFQQLVPTFLLGTASEELGLHEQTGCDISFLQFCFYREEFFVVAHPLLNPTAFFFAFDRKFLRRQLVAWLHFWLSLQPSRRWLVAWLHFWLSLQPSRRMLVAWLHFRLYVQHCRQWLPAWLHFWLSLQPSRRWLVAWLHFRLYVQPCRQWLPAWLHFWLSLQPSRRWLVAWLHFWLSLQPSLRHFSCTPCFLLDVLL
jgi:hypothetical protein